VPSDRSMPSFLQTAGSRFAPDQERIRSQEGANDHSSCSFTELYTKALKYRNCVVELLFL
jgi:hypothetical protein